MLTLGAGAVLMGPGLRSNSEPRVWPTRLHGFAQVAREAPGYLQK